MRRCRYIVFALLLMSGVLLHAETATYSVTSYHDISLSDGVAPEDSWATFNSTTARGSQITAGNSATISFYGYDGYEIRSVSLLMHSNKSSGGGSLRVTLNNVEVLAIPDCSFADQAWNGAYSSEWVNVTVPLSSTITVGQGAVFSIVVNASSNSLYVGGCTLTYRESSFIHLPKLVGFYTGTEESLMPIKESVGGGGVVLPSLPDADSVWHFLGWAEENISHTEVCPAYFQAGTTYYPKSNKTLYALYTNKLEVEPLVQDTTFETGVYALVSTEPHWSMMAGFVEEKRIGSNRAVAYQGADLLFRLDVERIPEESRYLITFTDSVATIKHLSSSRFIGYNASHSLNSSESEWGVLRTADHSLFFYHDRKPDGLMWGIHASTIREVTTYLDMELLVLSNQRFFLLFAVPDVEPQPTWYTSNPRSGLGMSSLKEDRMFRVFRLDGSYVMTATEDEMRNLPRGMYIISSPHGAQKRIVQ